MTVSIRKARRVGPALPGRMSWYFTSPQRCPQGGGPEGEPWFPVHLKGAIAMTVGVRKAWRVGPALPDRMSWYSRLSNGAPGRGSGGGTLVPPALERW